LKKRGRIFLGAVVLSLAVIFISTTMVHCSYPSVFEMSVSEKICLEQQRENQESGDRTGQDLGFTSMTPKFGSIRNIITANEKALAWLTRIFSVHPESVNAQISFQYLPRASPLPQLIY